MRVKELVALLKTLDQDRVVVLAKDSEGNSFSPVPDQDGVETVPGHQSACFAGER